MPQPASQGSNPTAPFRTGAGLFPLRLLATSDLHVHLLPWDYYTDRPAPMAGLSRTASLIAAARAEAAAAGATCLLLDNGDFLHGSPLGDLYLQDPTPAPHPMIAAMNALGYDCATLGNHEFSGGLPFLMTSLAQAAFPVVSANIGHSLAANPLYDATLVPPVTLLSRPICDAQGQSRALTIGLIGLVPPQTTQWDRQQLGDSLVTRDMLEAAAAHVPALRAKGADVVIALCHSGIGHPHQTGPNLEDATAALAALPGIDALIAGHTHQVFPSPAFAPEPGIDPQRGLLWGKPAVMPGFHGSHLGVIDLTLTFSGGGCQVAAASVQVRPVARRSRRGNITPLTRRDAAITAIATPAHRTTRAWTRAEIGTSEVALHSYFALVAPSAAVRIVAQAQAAQVAARLRGGPFAHLPLISAAAPFHAGGRGGPDNYTAIPAGPLQRRSAFDLYPHPNTVAALRVTGAELALWLERSFSLYHQVLPGAQDAALIDPDFPAFNFDLLDGLTWQVDLTQPPLCDAHGVQINPYARRIRDLCYAGRPVDPAAPFILATNSYRAAGSGHFPGVAPDRIVLWDAGPSRQVVLDHLARHGAAALSPFVPDWRFCPMPGTTAIFESSPAAAAHLAELAHLSPEPLDLTPEGFRRFRLHL